ncbi:MAG: DUF6293 family protein [Candidatus Woesearchaeota archaeon]
MLKKEKRVHIVPVGFEIDRIVIPLIENKADKIYFLMRDKEENAELHYKEIIKQLNKEGINNIEKIQVDMGNIYSITNKIRKIIEKEEKNNIFINVSSGSKLCSIGATMASMMIKTKKIHLYYGVPEDYNKEKQGELNVLSSGCKDCLDVPVYKIHLPDEELIQFLIKIKQLNIKGEIVTQKKLINFLPNLSKDDKKSNNPKVYMRLKRDYLDKLFYDWKLITFEGKGKNSEIKLTENGEELIKFFE